MSPTEHIYQIPALTTGTIYKIEVSSVNAVGESALSLSSNILFANTPTAPATLTLTSDSLPSLTATWTAPTTSNGDAVKGYKLYIDDGQGGNFVLAYDGSSVANVYTYTIGSNLVKCGILYNVKVTAINIAGEGVPAQS